MESTSTSPQPGTADRPRGLRERKRTRVKLMIQTEALKLFVEKGYEQTTVDDIAHAATMSSRTFFRYFPTKEDVVLWDEYDDLPFEEVWGDQRGSEPVAGLISKMREILEDTYRHDDKLVLTRIKLAFTVPEIRARFLDQQFNAIGPYYAQLAKTFDIPADDLRLPILLSALFGAVLVVVERWQRHDGRENLLDLFDDAVRVLADGMTEFRSATAR